MGWDERACTCSHSSHNHRHRHLVAGLCFFGTKGSAEREEEGERERMDATKGVAATCNKLALDATRIAVQYCVQLAICILQHVFGLPFSLVFSLFRRRRRRVRGKGGRRCRWKWMWASLQFRRGGGGGEGTATNPRRYLLCCRLVVWKHVLSDSVFVCVSTGRRDETREMRREMDRMLSLSVCVWLFFVKMRKTEDERERHCCCCCCEIWKGTNSTVVVVVVVVVVVRRPYPSLPSPCAHSTQLDLTRTRKKLKEKRQNKLNSWELWISFVFLSLIHRIPSTASRHLLLLHPLLVLSYVFL